MSKVKSSFRKMSLSRMMPTRRRAQAEAVWSFRKALARLVDLTNIGGLSTNLSSVEHHLVSTSSNILLTSETQLSAHVLSIFFSFSHEKANCA